MSESKYLNKIAWTVTALLLGITILFMNGGAFGLKQMTHTMGYETRLFDNTKVHTIDIVMDNWDAFIANAMSEEYETAAVVIDGEAYKNVGLRAKGNTSLSTVAALGSERYSFKIEFDCYDSSITYHGLDKLSLNNLIQDSTMMKDYLTYTMMNRFGVDSPLCSYVYITVNGEDWGLYLAVEGVEDSFLERNYGSDCGELYKPDSMSFGGGRGNGKDFEMPEGMGSSDVKLQYVDDELDSYSNIWNNAKTEITKADQKRLIDSLKKLSDGEEIESVVDIEQVIRYFVVHNYVCNDDSYTGRMVHNYYLYEDNGQLAMIPWDYNLAFGTFTAADANSTVNTPIDSPVSGGSSDRPMLNWIFESEEYNERYHQCFADFLSTVDIQGIISDAYGLIEAYVEKDPTAFYTCEEFETGVEALRKFCNLRSESISMQLEKEETVENMGYADASALSLADMGAMDAGMGKEGTEKRRMPGAPQDGEMPARPEGFDPSQMQGGFDGEMPARPEGFDPSQMQGGFDGKMPEEFGGGFDPGMNDTGSTASGNTDWIWLVVSVLLLGAGLILARLYKRS